MDLKSVTHAALFAISCATWNKPSTAFLSSTLDNSIISDTYVVTKSRYPLVKSKL